MIRNCQAAFRRSVTFRKAKIDSEQRVSFLCSRKAWRRGEREEKFCGKFESTTGRSESGFEQLNNSSIERQQRLSLPRSRHCEPFKANFPKRQALDKGSSNGCLVDGGRFFSETSVSMAVDVKRKTFLQLHFTISSLSLPFSLSRYVLDSSWR